jgi:putative N6-adenine-specific DNA methylase
MKPYRIFVVVQPGLEPFAEQEIHALGYQDLVSIKGGFFLYGHLSAVLRLNYACRTITRVLIEIAQFTARSFSQLESEFRKIDWKQFISIQDVCIRVTSYECALYHEKAISERLINSLSHSLLRTIHVVGSPDEPHTQFISVYGKQDRFVIRMDTTGAHLHKRGYGICKENAPLRETVAAAMLIASDWNPITEKLYDPMCGSGTIPLEAAMLAKRIPIFTHRSFSVQNWTNWQPIIHDRIVNDLTMDSAQVSPSPLMASDINAKAIDSAKQNAVRAGVYKLIDFENIALGKKSIDKDTVIITNPPWGKRISAAEISSIWKALYSYHRTARGVYLTLPAEQAGRFPYAYRELFAYSAGEITIKFVRLKG